jgi:hypothetical protein
MKHLSFSECNKVKETNPIKVEVFPAVILYDTDREKADTHIWTIFKFSGDFLFFKEKLFHTKFQVDISNGVQMGNGPNLIFF